MLVGRSCPADATRNADFLGAWTVYSLLVHVIVVPPINLLLLTIAGYVLVLYKKRSGFWCLSVGILGLFILALPVVAGTLLFWLEQLPRSDSARAAPAAIVILGGDVFRTQPPEPQAEIGELTLERVRTGAALQHATHLPVLTSGGVVMEKTPPVADLMADSLRADFGVEVRWIEATSRNTWENAANSAAILKPAGVRSIYLVTHAWHMRRALIAFSRLGLAVTPVPVPPAEAPRLEPQSFVPTASAWLTSYYALHEWIGCAWYALLVRVSA